MTIRLLIVDDHALVRHGLRLTFEGTDVDVVAEAIDGLDAFEKLKQQPVDVAMVDIRMPRADGFRFLELLRDAGLSLPVVLLHSIDDGMKSIRRCVDLGARGLIPKGHDKVELLEAVRKVYAGQQCWSGLGACNSAADSDG